MKLKTFTKKVSDMTTDQLKSVICGGMTDDMETCREAFEIIADKKVTRQSHKQEEGVFNERC